MPSSHSCSPNAEVYNVVFDSDIQVTNFIFVDPSTSSEVHTDEYPIHRFRRVGRHRTVHRDHDRLQAGGWEDEVQV